MSNDQTIPQGSQEQLRAQEMSLQAGHPPAQVPGYDFERFLGVGAYGQVWVAVERNTGRRVAIKFYAHRGGLDWSLLSHEVEKLAFLSADRYVVQLIGVGWDADPPYYVMEYVERGSLAERLQQGPLTVSEAVELFHDVAVGLMHAHGKGVLHCDLKPGNILLDQDNRPRLADFGQSRLSHEQMPALGTLFYMAPEQADLEAAPDARWDVYALGAVLYCMLTGHPPHRAPAAVEEIDQSADLVERLSHYRRLIRKSPPPADHRRRPGVDRALAEIVDGCLVADPRKRYPNVQAVLDALRTRAARRARRPMLVLGAVGPVLLLLVGLTFSWWGFGEAVRHSKEDLMRRALESNHFAAQYVARTAANQLDARLRAVEEVAATPRLHRLLAALIGDADVEAMLDRLCDAKVDPGELESLQRRFRELPQRQAFQRDFETLVAQRHHLVANSWFVTDARGTQVARIAENPVTATVAKNYSWRSYFNGLAQDQPNTWRAGPKEHITETSLSYVYLSQATNTWMVAVTTPIVGEDPQGGFRGVLGLTIEVGRFVELQGGDQQFAVLVDWREGDNKGVILQHPLFNKLREEQGTVPARFRDYRVTAAELPDNPSAARHYPDPLSRDPDAAEYRKQWLAQMEPVTVRKHDTGWIIIVQEAYDSAIGSPLSLLERELVRLGLLALAMVVIVILGLWAFAIRLLNQSEPRQRPASGGNLPDGSLTGSSGSGSVTPG